MAEPAVVMDGIVKSYGRFKAVDDVSFDIAQGEVFGFLGPNGAGKTTTLRILLDILQPDSGTRRVLGHISPLKMSHRIGYLPEERGLYKAMTPVRAITYFARLKGMTHKAARDRAKALLEQYGLGEVANKPIKTFSKGMAQKVQVLSCVAHDPDLVILDEPFSGLDPVNQQVLEGLIADLKAQGKTVIFSTHVMQHAERLCQRVIMIGRGQRRFYGSVEEACNTLSRRIRLTSPSVVDHLPGLHDMARQNDGAMQNYEGALAPGYSIDQVLKSALDQNVEIAGFSVQEPTLHDAFVALVGDDAREARVAA